MGSGWTDLCLTAWCWKPHYHGIFPDAFRIRLSDIYSAVNHDFFGRRIFVAADFTDAAEECLESVAAGSDICDSLPVLSLQL